MELEEIQSRKEHLRYLESRENDPETPQKAYLTMDDSEKTTEWISFPSITENRLLAAKDISPRNTLSLLSNLNEELSGTVITISAGDSGPFATNDFEMTSISPVILFPLMVSVCFSSFIIE